MADNNKTTGVRRIPRGSTGTDVHTTGKAVRGGDAHATGKALRDNNVHATGKADRGNARLQPYEQRGHVSINDSARASGHYEWPEEFELGGVKYKNDGILSDSSGEAIVFTVSRANKKFALKLYYYDPGHRPNHAILDKIKKLSGSGLLVNIIDHGEWSNPNGEKNDYELMDFCEGGSLENVNLAHDEKKMAEVAVKMGAAIDFLSKHGIIHRDIKPANFFYADKARTQIVLADFGISAECAQGSTTPIDEMRSPVYASPEFYSNVPGEPAEVGVESDYFSLGMSLLCLWMGKAKLSANENALRKAKLNETLTIPGDMSEHLQSLVRALTRLKVSDRANFNDIKRWAQGENLGAVNAASANSDFHVVYNSSKKQIAASPAELAHYLLEDKVLGKKYIYSGRVTRWLEETGRNEIAVNVEEIAEKIYPSNQEAGLMTVAYMLDPSLDYVDPMGDHHTDPKEISLKILEYHSEMSQEVIDPDSNLMIYLHALKMDKTVKAVREYVDSEAFDTGEELVNGFVACFYLAVMLNPDLGFPVMTKDELTSVETVRDLIDEYHKLDDLGFVNMALLQSQALVVWLSSRNPALAGKIRMLHDNLSDDVESIYYNSTSPYRIAYELDPEADFTFNTDSSSDDRYYTVPQMGTLLNIQLNDMVLGKRQGLDVLPLFEQMDEGRMGDYLRARGPEYAKFLQWNRYCMDTEDDENNQKAGPYDEVIGAYKSVTGFLGHAPTYPLAGKSISSPDDLEAFDKETIAHEMNHNMRERVLGSNGRPSPWLDAWLTVFFQENPRLDLSRKFTYEKKTAEYVEFIAKIDPENFYCKRYRKAIGKVDKAARKLKKSEASIKRRRKFYLIAGGVPTLIMLILSWFMDAPAANPISGHLFATYGICTIALLIGLSILTDFGAAIIPSLICGLISTGFIWAGFQWFPGVLYFIAGAILIVGAVTAIGALWERKEVDTGGKNITGSEFEYRQLDALYYAYHQTEDNLSNAVTMLSEMQTNEDDVTRENISFAGGIWMSLAWMFFIIWFFATPGLSGRNCWAPDAATVEARQAQKGKWAVGSWEVRYASGTTRIVCNIDSVEHGKNIYGTMIIAGGKPVEARGRVYTKNDTIPESFIFYPAESEGRKQVVEVEYSPNEYIYENGAGSHIKIFKGYYTDRKGIRHEITVTRMPDSAKGFVTNPPSTKPSSRAAGRKSSEKVDKKQASDDNDIPDSSVEKVESNSSGNILGEDTMH